MFSEEMFRSLVDSVKADIPSDLNDLPALYSHYEIPSDGYFCTTVVSDLLSARIRESLAVPADGSPRGEIVAELVALKKQILLSYFVDGTEYQPYRAVLNFICSSLSEDDRFGLVARNETNWRKAIRAAKEKNLLNPSTYEDPVETLSHTNTRECAVAEAVRYWRDKGYTLKPLMGKIVVEDAELVRMAAELESEIATWGGRKFAEFLFQKIKPNFSVQQERYHLVRRPTTVPSVKQRQIPFGHLFNLCVKHLESRHIEIFDQEGIFENVIHMAKMFGSIFDVQPYGFAERICVRPHEFLSFLEESALFDRMFSLPQWRPSDVRELLRGLFSWVAQHKRNRDLAWSVDEAATFAESVFTLCKNKREPHFFPVSALRRELGGMREQAFETFLDIFCHDAAAVNAAYLRPDRTLGPRQDFMFKPLVRINSFELCLMSSSWCAPAFYEALAMRLRDVWGNAIDTIIGDHLEPCIRQILTSRGITSAYGHYEARGSHRGACNEGQVLEGDCDLTVETDDTIILFEVKKKALTRLSRTGDSAQLLLDLAKGFIHGNQQLARQALVLKERGSLVLENQNRVHEIPLRGRDVERVFVTLDDYGAFQDRMIARLLAEFMTFVQISTEHENLTEIVAEIRVECGDLWDCLVRLRGESDWPPGGPFFNCRFISLPQLLVILDDANSNKSFKESLWLTRSHSFRTGDFYAEHYYHKRLREHVR